MVLPSAVRQQIGGEPAGAAQSRWHLFKYELPGRQGIQCLKQHGHHARVRRGAIRSHALGTRSQ
jgi:hypothetical protein